MSYRVLVSTSDTHWAGYVFHVHLVDIQQLSGVLSGGLGSCLLSLIVISVSRSFVPPAPWLWGCMAGGNVNVCSFDQPMSIPGDH